MSRYVQLFHDCPLTYRTGPHWDLMLERDGVLVTWSLAENPWPGEHEISLPCELLGDHRLAYLELEGPLSGDRGRVECIATGEFHWQVFEVDRQAVEFTTGPLRGYAEWRREQEQTWRLIWHPSCATTL